MAELTRTIIDAEHYVARYAQGRLSTAELEAFEEFCVLHPDVVEQVQTDRVLIEGLRQATPSRRSRFSRPQMFALAASALLAAFGLAFWKWNEAPRGESPFIYRGGSSLPALFAQQTVDIPVISISRGGPSTAVFAPPDAKALRLEFEPARTAGAGEYRVALAEEVDGTWLPRSELEHVIPEKRAVPTVIVIVDLARLKSPHLRITLGTGSETDEFYLSIRGASVGP